MVGLVYRWPRTESRIGSAYLSRFTVIVWGNEFLDCTRRPVVACAIDPTHPGQTQIQFPLR